MAWTKAKPALRWRYNFKQYLQRRCKIETHTGVVEMTCDAFCWCVLFPVNRLQRKLLWSTFPTRTWIFTTCRSAGPWLLAPCSSVSVLTYVLALQSSIYYAVGCVVQAFSVESSCNFPFVHLLPETLLLGHITHAVYRELLKIFLVDSFVCLNYGISLLLMHKMVTKPMHGLITYILDRFYSVLHKLCIWTKVNHVLKFKTDQPVL